MRPLYETYAAARLNIYKEELEKYHRGKDTQLDLLLRNELHDSIA